MTFAYIGLGILGLALAAFGVMQYRLLWFRSVGLLPARGKATMKDVERLMRRGHRVLAIRCYREIHRVSLTQAKLAVESLAKGG